MGFIRLILPYDMTVWKYLDKSVWVGRMIDVLKNCLDVNSIRESSVKWESSNKLRQMLSSNLVIHHVSMRLWLWKKRGKLPIWSNKILYEKAGHFEGTDNGW